MLTRATRARLAAQEGFTLATAMGVLLVVLLLSAAAYAEVDGDLLPQRQSEERRQAYAAAEAGVNDFLSRLLRDNSYWTKCQDPDNPALSGPAGVAPRAWSAVAQSPVGDRVPTAQFTVEMVPAKGDRCVPSDESSVLNEDGTFRIRVTGRPSATSPVRRTLVTTFRPRGFVNYIYLTDFETSHPAIGVLDTLGRETRRAGDGLSFPAWLAANCAGKGLRGRLAAGSYDGERRKPDGTWETFRESCTLIQFTEGDGVRGPFHTNDEVIICGGPLFGRKPKDRIEVGGIGAGWHAICGGSRPVVNFPGSGQPLRADVGTWQREQPRAEFPPSNADLKADAEVRLSGPTKVVFDGAHMDVTTWGADGVASQQRRAVPADGVIYVSNDPAAGACQGYRPLSPYPSDRACGDVYVSGTYGANVTVGAENDVIVDGDLVRQNDAYMLGLIPNHWARVYHPVTRSDDATTGYSCTNAPGALGDVQIDAAILALQNSFVVDNYDCGDKQGILHVRGAIAQRYRGPVGRGGSGGGSGYLKRYEYDARLERRSPPRYINPVEPPWSISSQTEQIPATP